MCEFCGKAGGFKTSETLNIVKILKFHKFHVCLKAYAGLGCMDVRSIPCYLINEHVHTCRDVDVQHVEI